MTVGDVPRPVDAAVWGRQHAQHRPIIVPTPQGVVETRCTDCDEAGPVYPSAVAASCAFVALRGAWSEPEIDFEARGLRFWAWACLGGVVMFLWACWKVIRTGGWS